MDLDDRLWSLKESVPAPDVPVEEMLSEAIHRGRRRRVASFMVAGATVIMMIVTVTLAVASGVFDWDPAPVPPTEGSVVEQLVGTYTATVSPDEPRARFFDLVGDFRMTITASGTIDLEGPDAFETRWTSPAGPIEDGGGAVRIFANHSHCGEFGTYSWGNFGTYESSRGPSSITFTVVRDPCDFRRILISREWTRVGGR